jgi:trigger factor
VELTIEPDAAFVEQAMRRAAKRVSRYRPVAGYRPGKAPYALVLRTFGRELLLEEALHGEAQTIYEQAVQEAKIEPLASGQMSIATPEPLTLTTRVSLPPEVTLGDYQAIRIEPEPEVAVEESEIDAEIATIRRRHAEVEVVERPLAMGDEAAATVKGLADGETVVEQPSAWWRVNDAMTPPGFAEAILGMTPGETREFTLSYPTDYTENENLAGKQVTFTAELRTIYAVTLPPLDDALATLEGEHESLDALRASVAERLKNTRLAASRAREAGAATEALIDISTFDYPDVMLESEVDSILANRQAMVQRLGWDFNAYLRMTGKTERELRDEAKPEAAKRVARELVLTELARAEGFTLDEQEAREAMNTWYNNVVANFGERAQQAAEQMLQRGAAQSVQRRALVDMASRHLADMATGRYVAPEPPVTETETEATEES